MERQTMGQERLSAFIDAVIAIIMTILVLELDKPKTLDGKDYGNCVKTFLHMHCPSSG